MAKAKASANEWDDLGIGDQVKHAKWGVGTILFRAGLGDLAKATVVFPEEGQKKLMLRYAKLNKVGSSTKSQIEAIAQGTFEPEPLEKPKEEVVVAVADAPGEEPGNPEVGAFDGDEEHQFDAKTKKAVDPDA